MNIYEKMVELNSKNVSFVQVTVTAKEGHGSQIPGAKMLVTSSGNIFGTIGGGAIEHLAVKTAIEMIQKSSTPTTLTYQLSDDNQIVDSIKTGMVCGGSMSLFYDCSLSKPNLYIFGAGHIGRAMASIIKNLEYNLTIFDCRTEIDSNINGADSVLIDDYVKIINDNNIKNASYIVIATHTHECDYKILSNIVSSSIQYKYLGVIGSKKKSRIILSRLKSELKEISSERLKSIYSPIGLKIGGTTPHEIAISIIAELQAVKNGISEVKHASELN